MADLIAKVGNNNTSREEVIGKFGVCVMNGTRQRSCDLCRANGFIITGTTFPPKDIHKLTRCEDSKPDCPCSSEWKHENIYIRHHGNERSRRIE